MERLTSARPLPDRLRGGVVALGNFDGFHRGHQAVVAAAAARARAERRPLVVATFDPHPVRFFRPDAPPFRLTTLDQRAGLFAAAGADAMLVFAFDAALAAVGAEAFVAEWLVARAGAAVVVTGQDFTFAKGRAGNVAVLAELAARHGIAAQAVTAIADEGGAVSSSRIRNALIAGDCETAAGLLTRPFTIEGVVQHGDKLGRALGFPTANLSMGDYLRPAFGIYAVRGRLADGRVLRGAANLGIRPSFDPPKELLEPFFFDFAGDLYDQTIAVEMVSFLRPEWKFDGLDALKLQIAEDCAEARRRLDTAGDSAQ
ncbi:MAG: adenylyltransferase / riboflavin kinase [Sphingomonas bacterium]|nr:adenylyltransferase / riboflavin kinase [Sphingomonas bacterium]